MGQCKIAVYAICKNEATHAARFMASMGEADGVWILDTGSTDTSPRLLRELGAHVSEQRITPWRFDDARNAALALVPADVDICVSCDLDEVFDPGWRAALESVWQDGVNRVSYPFYYDDTGSFFHRSLIHARHGFRWQWPIHEALVAEVPEKTVFCPGILQRHFPDPQKSRAGYLPMLEQAVLADPKDARMLRYLGREYLYAGRLQDAETVLWRHVAFEHWDAQQAASLHDLADMAWRQGDLQKAERLYLCAADRCPGRRESRIELARLCLSQNRPADALHHIETALQIERPDPHYFNEGYAWGDLPLQIKKAALAAIKKAAET